MSNPESQTEDTSARGRARAIIAAVIGNALDWYDFVVCAFVAGTIARFFFPVGDETVSLLLTFATFGVGFVTRRIGAVVLGIYADRSGRKKVLLLARSLCFS
jgi:MFS transporter, MHS family, proline/betaine transporter